MLNLPTLIIVDIAGYEDGLKTWDAIHQTRPDVPTMQNQWNAIAVKRLVSGVQLRSEEDKARFLAVQRPEAGAWMHALPSKSLGTLLDNKCFRIIMGLRLGIDICSPHACICGEKVDGTGRHGLKCKLCAGRRSRHAEMNSVLKRTLILADIPAQLEPPGLSREDGKRVDGMTLIPWSKGQTLIWDATCTDTLAPSNLQFSTRAAGGAAEDKARRKTRKYESLIDQNYFFIPFAVETMGAWCREATTFINELSKIITTKTSEPRSRAFITQRLSLAIQRGNAAAVMGTFSDGDKLNEIFYIF